MSHRRKKPIVTIQDGAKRHLLSCPPRSRDNASKLLELAKQDLDASRILRKEELFALSVFHMQQGFEKTLKAEMYLTGLYSDGEIRGFNHDVINAAENIAIKMAEHYGFEITDLGEMNALVKKNPDMIVRMSYDQICSFFNAQIIEQRRFQDLLRACGMDELAILSANATFNDINLLAVLLFYHQQSSRYMDVKNNSLTPFDYTSELGIVTALPDIGLELEMIIGELEKRILVVKYMEE